MLGHRLCLWPSVKPALCLRKVFAGVTCYPHIKTREGTCSTENLQMYVILISYNLKMYNGGGIYGGMEEDCRIQPHV